MGHKYEIYSYDVENFTGEYKHVLKYRTNSFIKAVYHTLLLRRQGYLYLRFEWR